MRIPRQSGPPPEPEPTPEPTPEPKPAPGPEPAPGPIRPGPLGRGCAALGRRAWALVGWALPAQALVLLPPALALPFGGRAATLVLLAVALPGTLLVAAAVGVPAAHWAAEPGARLTAAAGLRRVPAVFAVLAVVLVTALGPAGLAMAAGLPLPAALALLCCGAWAGVRGTLAPAYAALGLGPLAALRRSVRRVRGARAWWRTALLVGGSATGALALSWAVRLPWAVAGPLAWPPAWASGTRQALVAAALGTLAQGFVAAFPQAVAAALAREPEGPAGGAAPAGPSARSARVSRWSAG
ncbi:hypothetical protein ACN20G_21200 [Streptomyces sp. BI20]|uniref:hypothetical protein n=1 Tax=Streptomyces sp. BI20 TaxID=3403460 RepID=UPI003C74D7D2